MRAKSKLTLLFTMIVVSGAAVSSGVRAEIVRLDPAVRPTAESVTLTLDAGRKAYSGVVDAPLEVQKAASKIQFHATGMTFDALSLHGADGHPIAVRLDRGDEGLVTLTPDQALAPGEYALHVEFHNDFNTQAVGLYRMEYRGQGYLFTQFEAVDARHAFPCWDEPGFKIPWQITVKIPRDEVAVANTPIESSEPSGEWKIVRFRRTRPLPSYLIALAEGPLESIPIDGLSVPGRIYTVQGQTRLARLAAAETPGILRALEQYFGTPYPYAKLDLIAVPEFWYGAMENAGAVTFADRVLLVDTDHASVDQRRVLVSDVSHELAHMWFGDLVTMQWWDDLWLNETFASWMADKITQQLHPEFGAELSGRRRASNLMTIDAQPSTRAIRQPVTDESNLLTNVGLSYQKGRAVMEMIERWIDPEVFRRGIQQYLHDHAWGNATAADLWGALSAASGKDLAPVMKSFLDQPGVPLIRLRAAGGEVYEIAQQRFLNAGATAPAESWVLPLRIRFGGDFGAATRTVLLESKSTRIGLDHPAAWILPQADGIGYYRWDVPRPMLDRLATESSDLMSPAERVAFLGNAGALLNGGELAGDDYLHLLEGFAADPEPEVTTTLLQQLGSVDTAFVTESLRPQFAAYVRRLLEPVLDRIGMQPRGDESAAVSGLRPELLAWLGYQGRDEKVLEYGRREAQRFLEDPSSVDPALVPTVLRLAALHGDAELFETYRRRFEEASNPFDRNNFLMALGTFKAPELRQKAFDYLANGPLRPTEMLGFFRPRGTDSWRDAADRDQAFDWMRQHYEDIKSRVPAEFLAYLPYFVSGCSADRLAAGQQFFAQPDHQAPGTKANLERVAGQVADCVRLQKREGPAVARYLETHSGENTN